MKDGEYKTDIILDSHSPNTQALIAKLQDYLESYAESQGKAGEILPVYTEGEKGEVVIRFKQKAFALNNEIVLPRPILFDAKGNHLGCNIPSIQCGSQIAVSFEAWAYTLHESIREKGKRMNIITYGLALKPKAIQLVQLAANDDDITADSFGFSPVGSCESRELPLIKQQA
ncbi:hypothetical protein [Vibrio algivorus]|uniref:Uncharacterized protein n=1 Tax=Vibrio algivorus TaxID=1667024 RepID=A0ABQ6ER64_9VIBR|nr:hypothetical protein [Vibrio algivorus]GLT15516.1 hypothetical protein GCM10007931_24910 [Vibrio algivorus]